MIHNSDGMSSVILKVHFSSFFLQDLHLTLECCQRSGTRYRSRAELRFTS